MKIINKFKKIIKCYRRIRRSIRNAGFGKSWFVIFLDAIYCKLRLHATVDEYLRYQFYNYRNRYRKNFLLSYHQRKRYRKINTPGFTASKYEFSQKIPDCFSRELILAPLCGEEKFVEFAKKHGKIVTKPDTGSCGKNIEFFTYTDDQQAREYFAKLPDSTICEQFICQHEKMNAINPYSVNTIRIVSLLEGDQVDIISATLRTGGQADSMVDNLKKNGIGAQIDVATGIISTWGFDYNDQLYVTHPLTGTQLIGYNLPNWDQVIALVQNAHRRLPQCQILGWDVAITQTGVELVEANNAPGTPIMQLVDLRPRGEKVLAAIKKAPKKKKQRR